MIQPIGRKHMCVGAAESGGNPNTLYRAPYSQKHLRHLESALFLSNSRCEKCIFYDLKNLFFKLHVKLRVLCSGSVRMGFFYWESELHQSPSDFLCCGTDRLVDLKYPGQVFDVSVGTKLPTVSNVGLVESDDIPWFLLANAFLCMTHTQKRNSTVSLTDVRVFMNTLYTQRHARCLAGLSQPA